MKILFDIGATNTRAAAATESGVGEVVFSRTAEDPRAELEVLQALAEKILGNERPESAFGCIPGTPRADGTVLFTPNLPQWKGFPLGGEFSKRLGAPVFLEHDASLGALGEAIYGAGKGPENIAYFGIGTGVGAGRIVNGAIDAPIRGYEAGHQIMDAVHGISLDDMVSGRAITARWGVHPKDASREVYDELTAILAAGIYSTILHWHPDVFVLGGSLMNEENGYRLADIIEALKDFPPFFESLPDIRLAALGDASNLWGARALAQ